MKIIDEMEFHDLDFSKRQILAKVVAKRMVEAYKDDEEALLLVLTKGLMDAWTHEGWGYDEYQEDMAWYNDWDKES
jgi:hypothetical protein|tara:strand:+ start:729 stop:956 length:228 start_codon:yes stop_codon:yes gene_type:complete